MKKGLSRRNLFKYMGVGSATVIAAGCEQKPEKLIPLLVPPDEFSYMPHTSYHYMTTCQECAAGCGMMVTAREGRAQKAEGNPNHPLNQGTLCARGQASLQSLYNPSRLPFPQQSGKQLSWADAETEFTNQVKAANGQIAYLGKPETGSAKPFIEEWLKAAGGGNHVQFEVITQANQREANEIAFGRSDSALYAFDKAKYLLNFSTDFMETWGSVIENTRKFTEMHVFQDGTKNKFVHVGPHISLTGAKADEWVMVKPGNEGLMALSLAYEVRKNKGTHAFLAAYLAPYAPEKVAGQIGTSVEKIKKVAEEFGNSNPSLAVGGGNMIATAHGTETLVAINILNAVAGNLGKTLEFSSESSSAAHSHEDLMNLIQDLNDGKIKVLIVDNVNPVYALPKAAGFAEAMKKAFVVSLSSVQDETTHFANLVLPTLTPYESWGDASPRAGIRSICQPVMAPVNAFNAKAKEDILLGVNTQLNTGQFAGIVTYQDYLKKAWTEIQKGTGNSDPFDSFWINTLTEGGLFTNPARSPVSLRTDVVQTKIQISELEGKGLALLPSPSIMMGDGSGAKNPWLQEIPDPMTQIVWDSWMEINPETAKQSGIKDRDVVTVKTAQGSVNLTAYFHFGIHRDAIAIPLGQGHTRSGMAADNYGVNVLDLLPAKLDSKSGNFVWVSTKAEILPTSQKSFTVNVDGNARQIGRGIAAAATIESLKHSEHHEGHKRPVEFYPDRKETAGYYEPYRWGMTIDLDRCNGCSACVAACYAENNLSVVGKERTGLGREMSWIRLDRYIEGYGDDFEVRFSPITCQQCSNAGCETVCPVYATYHNSEGLNVQAYNRCVGTRYCSNNCAYKVRRFNWFNYEFPEPLNQQLNSTIGTRSVGVMEKCTFCVQRIKQSQTDARALGRDVQDGEVITACQQTCPTQAITFGNLMDDQSEVSKKAKRSEKEVEHRDRQYEILPGLNYKPAITYLKKVNLREVKSLGHSESSHG
ncbi:MAG: 4Fe-4S dicluster domain-containing protein [SAR324 cluster bacterium]|nr:4Fe-4S dicluster domain-containing protein [SAR324 cluster bacterium]